MSFGFGIGDIITIIDITLSVYDNIHEAPAVVSDAKVDLLYLHDTVYQVQSDLQELRITGYERFTELEASLRGILNPLKRDLNGMQNLLRKWHEPPTFCTPIAFGILHTRSMKQFRGSLSEHEMRFSNFIGRVTLAIQVVSVLGAPKSPPSTDQRSKIDQSISHLPLKPLEQTPSLDQVFTCGAFDDWMEWDDSGNVVTSSILTNGSKAPKAFTDFGRDADRVAADLESSDGFGLDSNQYVIGQGLPTAVKLLVGSILNLRTMEIVSDTLWSTLDAQFCLLERIHTLTAQFPLLEKVHKLVTEMLGLAEKMQDRLHTNQWPQKYTSQWKQIVLREIQSLLNLFEIFARELTDGTKKNNRVKKHPVGSANLTAFTDWLDRFGMGPLDLDGLAGSAEELLESLDTHALDFKHSADFAVEADRPATDALDPYGSASPASDLYRSKTNALESHLRTLSSALAMLLALAAASRSIDSGLEKRKGHKRETREMEFINAIADIEFLQNRSLRLRSIKDVARFTQDSEAAVG